MKTRAESSQNIKRLFKTIFSRSKTLHVNATGSEKYQFKHNFETQSQNLGTKNGPLLHENVHIIHMDLTDGKLAEKRA